MRGLLNELNEKFKFEPPSTGSWGYFQFGTDRTKNTEKDDELEPIDSDGPVGESNVTSNIDGGEGPPRTPYAFDGNRKKDKDKRDSNIKATGKDFKVVKSIYEILEDSIYELDDTLSEVSYTAYKKDERTGRQKVNGTLIDVYQKLKEIENLLDNNVRLKTEDNLHGEMWPKASPKRMQKIDKKLEVIKRKLKEMY